MPDALPKLPAADHIETPGNTRYRDRRLLRSIRYERHAARRSDTRAGRGAEVLSGRRYAADLVALMAYTGELSGAADFTGDRDR